MGLDTAGMAINEAHKDILNNWIRAYSTSCIGSIVWTVDNSPYKYTEKLEFSTRVETIAHR